MASLLSPVDNIPTRQSNGSEWAEWHKLLRKRYGRRTANTVFLEAWARRGCSGFGCAANTQELREYLSDNGIKVQTDIFEYYADKLDDIDDFFASTFNVAKWTGIGIAVFVFVVIGYVIVKIIGNEKITEGIVSTAGTAVTKIPSLPL